MFTFDSPEIKFTLQAIRLASQLARQIQTAMVSSALTKDDRSPVTVADFASQALVGRLLSQTFPGDTLVAEENASSLVAPGFERMLEQVAHFVGSYLPEANPQNICTWIDFHGAPSASRFWALDPIDGTKGFLRGDQYAIALSLIMDGQVQIGALGCPNLVAAYHPDQKGEGSLVFASRGLGAWTTPLFVEGEIFSLSVSKQQDPKPARLLRSFEAEHTNVNQIDIFAEKMGIQGSPIRMDSQAKYAVLAAGKGELLLRLLSPSKPNYREKIWDQAAGSIILEEAGGCITDLRGKPLDFTTGRELVNNRGILASNGHLHQLALQVIQALDI